MGAIELAKEAGADLVALPELAVTGYPPEDLLHKKDFVKKGLDSLHLIAREVSDIAAVVGFVDPGEGVLFNSAALIAEGRVLDIYHKHELPNYGVFDERRYFEPGEGLVLASVGDVLFGVTICEDLWVDDGPHSACAAAGASLIVNINASPFHMGKGREREELIRRRCIQNHVGFAYVNLVGGQDELVFDGQSSAYDAEGRLLARSDQFKEDLLVFDFPSSPTLPKSAESKEATRVVNLGNPRPKPSGITPRIASELESEAEAYAALVLGVRDYIGKNGFDTVLVGISGGIDSALTAAVAVDALGAEAVLGVTNPSEYTTERSITDAGELASNLGIDLLELSIEDSFEAVLKTLDPVFSGTEAGLAEENIQARLRGLIWMAISNKRGRIVLSTGNKSEMAVGYATLYGDMAGGFAVLKDVPKTLVYRLARWRNRDRVVIPESIIVRAPTAELRHGQLDTDALPDYEVLDPILEAYIEDEKDFEQIVGLGFDRETVAKVMEMVDRAEYKRRQAPPGIKITDRAFGRDRRLPITNRFRSYR